MPPFGYLLLADFLAIRLDFLQRLGDELPNRRVLSCAHSANDGLEMELYNIGGRERSSLRREGGFESALCLGWRA
jgi:hypothetical protein